MFFFFNLQFYHWAVVRKLRCDRKPHHPWITSDSHSCMLKYTKLSAASSWSLLFKQHHEPVNIFCFCLNSVIQCKIFYFILFESFNKKDAAISLHKNKTISSSSCSTCTINLAPSVCNVVMSSTWSSFITGNFESTVQSHQRTLPSMGCKSFRRLLDKLPAECHMGFEEKWLPFGISIIMAK